MGKVARYLANLFNKSVESAIITGERENYESIRRSCEKLKEQIAWHKKHNDHLVKMLDKQNDYVKQMMMEFERKGQMTFDEFCLWHNHYTNTTNWKD